MREIIAGRYQFARDEEHLLGTGGMGLVFRGVDLETDQFVAIKHLRPDVIAEDPGILERFRREGEALSVLNHPNIVGVLDAVEEDDHHYIVIEYAPGGSLRDLLDQTPMLPLRRVLEIGIDLADALTRAHRLKIIHRDIKPANVLLAEDGTPRLTDFGVARVEDGAGITRSGMVVGTVHYVAPEALEGQPTDERMDIWALGVMLYEMLAGQRPFTGDSMTALIATILTKPLPDVRRLRPDVPEALVTLLEQMMTKDVRQRLASSRRVGAELESILAALNRDEGLDVASEQTGRAIFEMPPTTPIEMATSAY